MDNQKGFTLIELLVVIAIIGVLASVVLASLNSARSKSADTARVATLRQFVTALEGYYSQNGSYPGAIAHYSTCPDVNVNPWANGFPSGFFGTFISDPSTSELFTDKCLYYSKAQSTVWRCYPQASGTANEINPANYHYFIVFPSESELSYTDYPRFNSNPNLRCIFGRPR